jgi:dTDP-4-amino-4,6-dideoxygalactose transaminase
VAVPFLDLAADWNEVADDARARIDSVLSTTAYVLGPQTNELEASMRAELGCEYAYAVSSGSDALYLALLALDIGPGDAVLLPSFTFFATAGAVVRAGALPVFVDLDTRSWNAELEQFQDALLRYETSGSAPARVRAIIAVHLYGRCVEMTPLMEWARRKGFSVIEDAAQAIGASGEAGNAGTVGDIGCFSFYPTKNLGSAGDGGLVTTNDEALAKRLARLRVHGAGGAAYQHEEVGINARMGELQAAVLNAKLPRLRDWTEWRRARAAQYIELLGGLSGVMLPEVPEVGDHVWHQFAVRIPGRRDEVQRLLNRVEVQSRVFYPIPLHRQQCFAGAWEEACGESSAATLPRSEAAAAEVLCLPMFASLSSEAVSEVCAELEAALAL